MYAITLIVLFFFFFTFFPRTQQQTKTKSVFWKSAVGIFLLQKKKSNGPFTLRGALNCTLTMNFVKSFVLIHALILIPLVVWL